eukprot:6088519-Pleurochrysis_carterae.AAC.1
MGTGKGESMGFARRLATADARAHDAAKGKERIKCKQHRNETLSHFSQHCANPCEAIRIGAPLSFR